MYCPRCGKQYSVDTSFCRTCGLALDGVSSIVSGEASTEPEFKRRPNEMLIRAGIGISILGLVIAIGNAALSSALGFREDIGRVIFLTFVAIGLACLGLGFVFPTKRYTKKRAMPAVQNDEKSPKFTTSPLPDELGSGPATTSEVEFPIDHRELVNAEPVSVVEHTTRNLSQ